jgi:hypothetical protein
MRHLFIRGGYKPLGVSGEAMIEALLSLKPEIYGSIADEERVEVNGLLYIFQRLPQGVEECRYIKLITKEGFEASHFEPIIPSKRRRNCYRIDDEQMFIEMTRGRSDIYDVLTHLTFMYIEAEKIRKNSFDMKNRPSRSWTMLEKVVQNIKSEGTFNEEVGITYLSALLGRTFDETYKFVKKFESTDKVNSLFSIVYWLGKRSQDEHMDQMDREISFSSSLREKLGHHIYGEHWANNIKQLLYDKGWYHRPIHVISSNMHSVMNAIYAKAALGAKAKKLSFQEVASELSKEKNESLRKTVFKYAQKHGLIEMDDSSGTNIPVQIIDCNQIDIKLVPKELDISITLENCKDKILVVMDYAFGEQAYEVMDELLKPFETDIARLPIDIRSINIMGKAGILEGGKGDVMIPTAHIFEGSADNYPIENIFTKADFEGNGLKVFEGPMITVLGTSLQNKDILRYFLKSSWKAIGLEMEGAHYQKAIQAASKIRNSISKDVKLSYAYYASDNPLETGSTLASGSLGIEGVKPTYLITGKILKSIYENCQ